MSRGQRVVTGVAQGAIVGALFVLLSGWLTGEEISIARFAVAVPVFGVGFGIASYLALPTRWHGHPLGLRRQEPRDGENEPLKRRLPDE